MAIRSFTGYLNATLFGGEFVNTGATFSTAPSSTTELNILLSDDDTDLVAEGDSVPGNSNTEQSEDSQGDQVAFIQNDGGTVLTDGDEFYLEASFEFTVGGQTFTGYHFETEGGLDFTILPPDVPGGTATVTSVDFTPSPDSVPYAAVASGDEEINDAPYANLDLTGADTIIAGDGDDTINAEGGADVISGGEGSDTINAGGGADEVDAGSGNDTVNGGGGADEIFGNAGSDTLNGGGGNDIIRGDSLPESSDFSSIPDPSGDGTPIDDGDDLSGGISYTSGGVQVDITFADDGQAEGFDYNNSDGQNSGGLNDGQGASDNAILLRGNGTGDTSTTTIDFSTTDVGIEGEVTNVNFKLNDIDEFSGIWQDTVTVTAFDADGNPVEVTLTGGANHTLTDTDGVAGVDTATANLGTGNQTPNTDAASLLVEIDGPVATIVISYGNLGTGGQRIDLTEIFYDIVPVEDPVDGSDDIIDGAAGNDIIYGDQGNDDIQGGTGSDDIDGGADDDILDGGAGVDTIAGGTGDDEIRISTGADTISGGAGTDTFTAEDGTSLTGETIEVSVDGTGSGTINKTNDGTTDTVEDVEVFIADEDPAEADRFTYNGTDLTRSDITGIGDAAIGTFTPDGGGTPVAFGGPGQPTLSQLLSGTFDPGTGVIKPVGDFTITDGVEDGTLGSITFENFEIIEFSTVVCFAAGTRIKTNNGLCPIEDLQVGVFVATLDHGAQPIRWIGKRTLSSIELATMPNLRPIRIKAGALAKGVPRSDLIVSPQHRILVRSKIAIRMFDTNEIFVAAKHLLGLDGVDIADDLNTVTYIHLMCNDHEIIEADGAFTETLYTGTEAMKAMSSAAKQEIDAIFGSQPYLNRPLARSTPKGKMVKKLVERHIRNNKQLV